MKNMNKQSRLIKEIKKIDIIGSLKISLILVALIYVIVFPLALFFYSIITIKDTGLILMSFFNLIFFALVLYIIKKGEI
jgi:hypothetical protein